MDVDLNAMTEFIGPVAGNETWDYALYFLFAVGMIALAFMNSKGARQMDSYFITIATFFVVLDKLYVFGFLFAGPESLDFADLGGYTTEQLKPIVVATHTKHLGTYLIRVLMFVLPLVVIGSTRSARVRIFAGIFTISAGVYSAGRWFDQIYDPADTKPTTGAMAMLQASMLIIVLGDLLYRWYWLRHRRIDG